MEQILKASGDSYIFIDKNTSICCGRPLKLLGRESEGKILMDKNRDLINGSGAQILVTSCPICYKMFREDYGLEIPVMHHSEYIKVLLDNNLIKLRKSNLRLVYHDPCELGRGSDIYDQPRLVISSVGNLIEPGNKREESICCGGSLGNTVLGVPERKKITQYALENLTAGNPDQIITGCPLCKKTFAKEAHQPVFDIAEVVAKTLVTEKKKSRKLVSKLTLVE
jgi:Fe-S oxidoreductase